MPIPSDTSREEVRLFKENTVSGSLIERLFLSQKVVLRLVAPHRAVAAAASASAPPLRCFVEVDVVSLSVQVKEGADFVEICRTASEVEASGVWRERHLAERNKPRAIIIVDGAMSIVLQ
mmetsp:Transcript_64618/g.76508  ORF Transcript_64618/g.76508 Transcript_64618/m.76508 type:complete len:120 (-) Transcript_64618:214-573(-)